MAERLPATFSTHPWPCPGYRWWCGTGRRMDGRATMSVERHKCARPPLYRITIAAAAATAGDGVVSAARARTHARAHAPRTARSVAAGNGDCSRPRLCSAGTKRARAQYRSRRVSRRTVSHRPHRVHHNRVPHIRTTTAVVSPVSDKNLNARKSFFCFDFPLRNSPRFLSSWNSKY